MTRENKAVLVAKRPRALVILATMSQACTCTAPAPLPGTPLAPTASTARTPVAPPPLPEIDSATRDSASTYEPNGWRLVVTLEPEKARIVLGEPIYVVFRVHNDSAVDLQTIEGGGRPKTDRVAVVDENGVAAPHPPFRPDFGGLRGPQKIPSRGDYKAWFFLPDWAPFAKAGHYRITYRHVLALGPYTRDWDPSDPRLRLETEASAEVEVLPADAAEMGRVIDGIGQRMFGADADDSRRAVFAMAPIDDERAVPYLVRAVDVGGYTLKFGALEALSKFASDAALAAIEKGLKDDDTNIRDAAVVSLRVSRHPHAYAALLAEQGNPSDNIRLTVVHALGERNTPEATALLRKMARDESPVVSGEAKRYLKERGK